MSVHPPRPKGPHLNAMRSFEAAARLGGFAAAADELSVTSGAVSQQIKLLEEWIGAPLFERRSRGVALTPLGEKAAAPFSAAFDGLGEALSALRENAPAATLNIAALPAIAQLWLAPRLQQVNQVLPNQSISVTALEQAPNLLREIFDVSVFYGTPSGRARAHVIERDVIFPVCAPEMLTELQGIEDVLNAPRILDTAWAQDWSIWCDGVGVRDEVETLGAQFSLYSLALQQARNGAGILIGHAALVEQDLKDGTLVAPVNIKVATGKSLIVETLKPAKAGTRLAKLLEVLTA